MTIDLRFPPDPASVSAARRSVVDALQGADPDTVELVRLLVSELATNAVEHAATAFRLRIDRGNRQVRVSVTDDGGGRPEVRSPGDSEPRGRGLSLDTAGVDDQM